MNNSQARFFARSRGYSRSETTKLLGICQFWLTCLVLPAVWPATPTCAADRPAQLNVLMIIVDDLRPALGCYGDEVAITPHIDELASRGMLFQHAYCQLAVCAPSRLSMLTGLRPDTIQVWDLATHFRQSRPNAVTLPQYFRQQGYITQSIGKVFHGSGKPAKDPPSWTVAPTWDVVRDPALRYAAKENLAGSGLKRASHESVHVDDDYYVDGKVCTDAVRALRALTEQERPFFLAVGFRKPHLPFCAPTRYWDRYQADKISLPKSPAVPIDAPELAIRSWQELEGYQDIPKNGELSDEKVRQLRHGYYACVSYIDELVGRLVQSLHQQGLADSTVVVLTGDHGYHLGEQGLWTKSNNYELSTRVPLIITLPQAHWPNLSGATKGLVELVDIYPTLVDICGLPARDELEGVSFLPLIKSPDLPWKTAVFHQFPRARKGKRHRGRGDIMGYAVRNHRYRLVQWKDWSTDSPVAWELYDHDVDPGETRNLAGQKGWANAQQDLLSTLQRGWKAALPKETSNRD